jgi:hypothetical protein
MNRKYAYTVETRDRRIWVIRVCNHPYAADPVGEIEISGESYTAIHQSKVIGTYPGLYAAWDAIADVDMGVAS